jgi:hypothetical protein
MELVFFHTDFILISWLSNILVERGNADESIGAQNMSISDILIE